MEASRAHRPAGGHRGDGRGPACSLALDAGVHMLQVGARNALNYSLLRSIGARGRRSATRSVLLKRSLHMGPLNEFISAAEYIAAFGNPNVILCPRGTAPGARRLPQPPRREHHAAAQGEDLGARGRRPLAFRGPGRLRARLRARRRGLRGGRALHGGACGARATASATTPNRRLRRPCSRRPWQRRSRYGPFVTVPLA